MSRDDKELLPNDRLPKIVILSSRENEHIVELVNALVVYKTNQEQTISEFYNEEIKKYPDTDIFGFMNCWDSFNSQYNAEDIVDEIQSKLLSDRQISGIYSDQWVLDDVTQIGFYKPNYPYDVNLSKERINIISSPLFIRSSIAIPFHPKLNDFCIWDMIRRLSQNHLLYHIPKPMFTRHLNDTPKNIEEEMKILNDKKHSSHSPD